MLKLLIRFRNFLNRNKIYFETIVMAALTVAGICVSCSANKITQRQASIEEALAKPIINIETIYNENNTRIEELNIINDGSAVRNLELEVVPYYFTSVYTQVDDKGYKIESFILPIEDSIAPVFSITNYNTKTGLLGSISSSSCTSQYIDDMVSFQDFVDGALATEFNLAFLSLEYYVKIHYTDIFGNNETEVYNCVTGNNQTYSSLAIQFIRDCQLSAISTGSSQNNIVGKLYGGNNIKYIRYGNDSSELYVNFVHTATDAFSNNQLFFD